jgi:hypothetical protein
MRYAVLVFFALAGSLGSAQAPDAPPQGEGEKREEETKFTAQRLSAMASLNRQSFLNRFAGRTLDVRGTVVLRDLTNGTATVQLWRRSGQAGLDVTCRAADQASLQAAAVLAENQDVRVSGSVSPEASDAREIVLAPCTILTNNINISPTAELAAPLAKSEAKQGPPPGRYRCVEEDDNTFTGWLSILPRNRYTQPTGEPGRYKFDDKLNRVFFGPGSLAGWQAEFSISSKGRILTLISSDGTKRRCSWQGQ